MKALEVGLARGLCLNGAAYPASSDPRGPLRTVRAVDTNNGGPVLVAFAECEHAVERVNHFSYRVGDRDRCFKCGQATLRGGK